MRLDEVDVKRERIRVRGKGYKDGKERDLPFHPDTIDILNTYFEYRGLQKQIASMKFPGLPVYDDGSLIVHRRKNQIVGYRRTAIDELVHRVSVNSGIEFTAHDLRRTFGRRMYDATKNVAVVSYALGHTNTETTIKYLGIKFDDVKLGLQLMHQEYAQPGTRQTQNRIEVNRYARKRSESAEN